MKQIALDPERKEGVRNRIALLASFNEIELNDITNGYIREFLRTDGLFLNINEIYFRFGQRLGESHIISMLRSHGIETLLYIPNSRDFHFSVSFFKTVQQSVFTAMTLSDPVHFFESHDIYYAQAMDLVLVYDCFSKYRFRDYGLASISFYPSYDKSKYHIKNTLKRDIDCSFVGDLTVKQGRRENIDFLVRNGIPVKTFGAGSESGMIPIEIMIELFNRTKINLNFGGISRWTGLRNEPRINQRLKQIKGRLAEIALCGGFVLTEYTPGVEEVFDIDREIGVFRSREEMLEKVVYYLRYDEERENIALQGHRRAMKDYETSTAIPRLINEIKIYQEKRVRHSEEIIIDRHFTRHYATFRVEMMVEFIKRRKWRLVLEELMIIIRCRTIDIGQASAMLLGLTPWLKGLIKKIYFKRV